MACPLHKHVSAGKGLAPSRPVQHACAGRFERGNACVASSSLSSSTTAITTSSEPSKTVDGSDSIRVKVTPPREVSQPPSPPSLIHSPVYVQKALIKQSAASSPTSSSSPPASVARLSNVDDERDGNSLMWALKQVDRSLDELEQNPLPLQREIYELSRGPVGTATSSALGTAAKVTVAATREAVKAAVPVGQWVVREGAKAAVSLVSRAMAESAKLQQQQQQDKDGGKKKGK
ncbi:hypothetical protein PLESTF_001966300 [Pleodorina starrii]|nr:hypothetical protein PLESTM_001886200 [Pleodorina starrii]GLC77638.1 hypothetical protein PLESTF_001966300 [Pleodorina starrii]